ncbi:MAG: hypothetical protein WC231_07045 [Dehalococcoidales bacterium]|jgi:hypothetical protein|nr:hypothetical protein [Dehalococcoidales bacterium]MDD5605680.1 hypothetical protein [Dehalococcoidales bacterium]MDX9986216.1 hypothetical protein [Dehalococcoidales bacterium]NLE90824.1 hypothetical protein [Dehalococcoidales bacterium]
MGDILDEAYSIVQCKDCPWYKACVTPMRFTAEDIQRQMQASNLEITGQQDIQNQQLIASMAAAAQASLVEGCPIFVERLRSNPKLSQRIKEIMQNWSEE